MIYSKNVDFLQFWNYFFMKIHKCLCSLKKKGEIFNNNNNKKKSPLAKVGHWVKLITNQNIDLILSVKVFY